MLQLQTAEIDQVTLEPEKDRLEKISEHQLLENPDVHCSLHNGTKQRNIFGDIVT